MLEIWKFVKDYENCYKVSNLGRVISFAREYPTGYVPRKEEIVMKFKYNWDGYQHVILSAKGKRKIFSVHQLVANHFIPNIANKREVNHIDGVKRNNISTNLEWATRSENIKHAFNSGLKIPSYGEANGLSKLTKNEVVEIVESILTKKELATKYNISRSVIYKIKRGETWSHLTNIKPIPGKRLSKEQDTLYL